MILKKKKFHLVSLKMQLYQRIQFMIIKILPLGVKILPLGKDGWVTRKYNNIDEYIRGAVGVANKIL